MDATEQPKYIELREIGVGPFNTMAEARKKALELSKDNPKTYYTIASVFGFFVVPSKRLSIFAPSDSPVPYYYHAGKEIAFTKAQVIADQNATPTMREQQPSRTTHPNMIQWQYAELIAELGELQAHASDPNCPCNQASMGDDGQHNGEYCQPKHTLRISYLARETAAMVSDTETIQMLSQLQEEALSLHTALKDRIVCGDIHEDEVDAVEWSRGWRKKLEAIYYHLSCPVELHERANDADADIAAGRVHHSANLSELLGYLHEEAITIKKIEAAHIEYGDRAAQSKAPARYGIYSGDKLLGYIYSQARGYMSPSVPWSVATERGTLLQVFYNPDAFTKAKEYAKKYFAESELSEQPRDFSGLFGQAAMPPRRTYPVTLNITKISRGKPSVSLGEAQQEDTPVEATRDMAGLFEGPKPRLQFTDLEYIQGLPYQGRERHVIISQFAKAGWRYLGDKDKPDQFIVNRYGLQDVQQTTIKLAKGHEATFWIGRPTNAAGRKEVERLAHEKLPRVEHETLPAKWAAEYVEGYEGKKSAAEDAAIHAWYAEHPEEDKLAESPVLAHLKKAAEMEIEAARAYSLWMDEAEASGDSQTARVYHDIIPDEVPEHYEKFRRRIAELEETGASTIKEGDRVISLKDSRHGEVWDIEDDYAHVLFDGQKGESYVPVDSLVLEAKPRKHERLLELVTLSSPKEKGRLDWMSREKKWKVIVYCGKRDKEVARVEDRDEAVRLLQTAIKNPSEYCRDTSRLLEIVGHAIEKSETVEVTN